MSLRKNWLLKNKNLKGENHMAKIGLNYGEKLQIADKTYRVITDGLDVPAVLGKLTFRGH